MTDLTVVDTRHDLLPAPVAQLNELADFMAASGPMVPPAFQGKPDRCRAVAYRAARWGLDPFAVCDKAYVTKDKGGNERIAFEAQLVAAVVLANAPLDDAPHYSYSGNGQTRQCKVSARLRGDPREKEYETPTLAQIKVKNSPNWFSDPDQQLGYFAIRAWARRHTPDVILGAYTKEELEVAGHVVDGDGPAPDRTAALFDDSEPADAEFVDGAAPAEGGLLARVDKALEFMRAASTVADADKVWELASGLRDDLAALDDDALLLSISEAYELRVRDIEEAKAAA